MLFLASFLSAVPGPFKKACLPRRCKCDICYEKDMACQVCNSPGDTPAVYLGSCSAW